MKVALYARVSSPEALQRQDTENQLVPMLEFINRHGWDLYHSYIDHMTAKQGKKRPALDQLMNDAAHMKFDVVVVWKLDRFARSMTDFVHLISQLDKHKIRFLTITQPIDTDQQSATGRLLMNMLAAFAEFERELIRERISASIANRKSKGLPVGKERVFVDEMKLEEYYKDGKSIRQIARLLEVKKSTIENRIKELNIRGVSKSPKEIGEWTGIIEITETVEL